MSPNPVRLRIGAHGQVHLALGMTTTCGLAVECGDPTDDPVTCRTCLGDRVWRGHREASKARPVEPPTAAEQARDLRRADAALLRLEELNHAAFDAWRAANGYTLGAKTHGQTPRPPEEAFPPPPADVTGLLAELQVRYEGRMRLRALRCTVTAHDELLRLQQYLLPRCDRERERQAS